MTQHFALSETELADEMKAISDMWRLLKPLDSAARMRALSWLQAWVHEEAPKRSHHDSL